jgi:hypothetical protein
MHVQTIFNSLTPASITAALEALTEAATEKTAGKAATAAERISLRAAGGDGC